MTHVSKHAKKKLSQQNVIKQNKEETKRRKKESKMMKYCKQKLKLSPILNLKKLNYYAMKKFCFSLTLSLFRSHFRCFLYAWCMKWWWFVFFIYKLQIDKELVCFYCYTGFLFLTEVLFSCYEKKVSSLIVIVV